MIKSYKPTSAGIRFRKTLVKKVSKAGPEKSLIFALNGPAGRSHGKIASRHQQRGAKKFYRIIDFKRDKLNIPAKVSSIEHDPNRGANIALVYYADGEKRYILLPTGMKKGDSLMADDRAEVKTGNAMKLKSMPVGTLVHNVEMTPGRGGQIGRSAGTSLIIQAKEGGYAHLKMPSGEIRMISLEAMATVGVLGNEEWKNRVIGKAGRNRHKGIRPSQKRELG